MKRHTYYETKWLNTEKYTKSCLHIYLVKNRYFDLAAYSTTNITT